MAARTSPQRYSCSPPNTPTEVTALRTHSVPASRSPGRTSPASSAVTMEPVCNDARQMRRMYIWIFPSSRPSSPSMPVPTAHGDGRTAVEGNEGTDQGHLVVEQVAVLQVRWCPWSPVGPREGLLHRQAWWSVVRTGWWLSVPLDVVVVLVAGAVPGPAGRHSAVLPTPAGPQLRPPRKIRGPCQRVRLPLLLPGGQDSVPPANDWRVGGCRWRNRWGCGGGRNDLFVGDGRGRGRFGW